MLWLKAFHIIFMVTWFAGLFYLPRLFVYHVQAADQIGKDRFCVMEKKLFIIMSIGAVLTLLSGFALLTGYLPAYASQGWMHGKLLVVLLLLGFHLHCWIWMRQLGEERSKKSERFFRIVNEVPAIALVAAVILVVVKPGMG